MNGINESFLKSAIRSQKLHPDVVMCGRPGRESESAESTYDTVTSPQKIQTTNNHYAGDKQFKFSSSK